MNNIYNDMFALSSIKAKNKLGNGSVQQLTNTTKGTYDLENRNVYDDKTGELVKKGTQIEYNTQFLLRLKRLYILEIKPFLNHHLTNSNNKSEFFDYVKYAALNSEIIKHQGQKQAINDWVNDNEQLFKVNPISKSEKHLKELHNNIFISNAFEVFEKYHTNKNLAENCKTDLRVLFQLFEKDNLFVETVELKHYIKWLNKTYAYSIIELKKVDINSKPSIQRTNDYNEYKRTTLK